MARTEWMERRLNNWALWLERQRAGGLGYASQSIFADGPAARGRADVDGPRIPVLEIEAAETHEAVESLKLTHSHLYQTLHHFYLKNRGIKGTAQAMRRAPSTIHAQLVQADTLLTAWLADPNRRGARQVAVQRLAPPEAEALQQQLAAARPPARPSARAFIGPPAPPVRRNRPTLVIRSRK